MTDEQKMALPWKFFAQRHDYNRWLVILPMKHDAENRALWPCKWTPIQRPNPFYGTAPLVGNEDFENFIPMTEGQQLFDALWDAGMRPTRR